MQKIPTLFVRDETTKKVRDELAVPIDRLIGTYPTEKIDGTNVRLTVRSGELIRVEGRKNPTKQQKAREILEPWYREAWIFGGEDPTKADEYIVEAAQNTDLSEVPDGEWSGEAVGPAIQGNPLGLEQREVVLFSVPSILERRLMFAGEHNPGLDFGALRDFFGATRSMLNPEVPIEGIVWWRIGTNLAEQVTRLEAVAKIKAKDFA